MRHFLYRSLFLASPMMGISNILATSELENPQEKLFRLSQRACEKYRLEPLIIKEKEIYTIASFLDGDYFSVYSSEGEFLWEIGFKTQIQYFQEKEDHLFFLSKSRSGQIYFISCFNKKGRLLWENSIVAPQITAS